MKRIRTIIVLIAFSTVAISCGGKQIKTVPDDPVKKYKQEFLDQYGFFVTNKEIVSYYQDILGVMGKENEIFKNLKTIEEVDKFIEVFFKVRDPNPNTPENEFKDAKDQNIQDIKNEILATDLDIPGTYFANNGGLKGDLARVYLLYGVPHYKAKLHEGAYHIDLMVWYYFDVQGKPLFRFLFYNKYGSIRLFKDHMSINSLDELVNPLMSPLKEISNKFAATSEELYQVWLELERDDPEKIFIAALFQFSPYADVVIEGGDIRNKKFGALDPPEPAALTAVRSKPIVLGQPSDLTGRKFINSSYNSFIPAKLEITKDARPSLSLKIGYAAVDWEVKGENAEFVLDLRISFQNKATRNIKEFSVKFSKIKPREEVETKRKIGVVMNIPLDDIQNFAHVEEPRQTLRQLIDNLEPGAYVVNIDLRHAVTKKSAGGWREEIVIK